MPQKRQSALDVSVKQSLQKRKKSQETSPPEASNGGAEGGSRFAGCFSADPAMIRTSLTITKRHVCAYNTQPTKDQVITTENSGTHLLQKLLVQKIRPVPSPTKSNFAQKSGKTRL